MKCKSVLEIHQSQQVAQKGWHILTFCRPSWALCNAWNITDIGKDNGAFVFHIILEQFTPRVGFLMLWASLCPDAVTS